jgi:hypothetical protein
MKPVRNAPLAIFVGGLCIAFVVSLLTAPPSSGEQPSKKRAAVPAQARTQTLAQATTPAHSRAEFAEAAVPVVVFAPLYGSRPRIIHVPQAGDNAQADADESVGAIGDDISYRRVSPTPHR